MVKSRYSSPVRQAFDEKLDGMFMKQMIGSTKLNNIQPGDKLAFWTAGIGTHTAIYVGNDRIVEVDTKGKESLKSVIGMSVKGIIKLVQLDYGMLEKFTGNIGLKEAIYNRHQIVERAMSKVGVEFDYSVYNDNCNHFTAWCQKGQKELDTCTIFTLHTIKYDNVILNYSDLLSKISNKTSISQSEVLDKTINCDQNLIYSLCLGGNLEALCDIVASNDIQTIGDDGVLNADYNNYN
jgi:hypothetical protein